MSGKGKLSATNTAAAAMIRTKPGPASASPSGNGKKPVGPKMTRTVSSSSATRPSSTPPMSRSVTTSGLSGTRKMGSPLSGSKVPASSDRETEARINTLNAALDAKDTEVLLLRTQLEAALAQADSVNSSFASELSSQSVFAAQDAVIRDMRAENDGLVLGMKDMQSKLTTRDMVIDKLEKRIAALTRKDPMAQTVDSLMVEKDDIEARYDQVLKDKDSIINAMRVQIDVQIGNLSAEVKSKDMLVTQANEELLRLNAIIETQAAAIEKFGKALNLTPRSASNPSASGEVLLVKESQAQGVANAAEESA
ncbi:hypothetical protein BC830DRAFT_1088760 [Chytriomyces sp. MP71]|nr:hypothetical protein BC830DRAFT_1088760 [Chytriomyces sp. MP71]